MRKCRQELQELYNNVNRTIPESGLAVNHLVMNFCKAGILHSRNTPTLSAIIAEWNNQN
jgi:hypothetical protein